MEAAFRAMKDVLELRPVCEVATKWWTVECAAAAATPEGTAP